MECLIGIQGKDFVLMAADTVSARSIVKMKNDQDKMFMLSDKLLMAVAGESGDTVQFAEYVSKNMQLYKMKNGYDLSANAAAHFTRWNIAEALRTPRPKVVNILMAGTNDEGPALYFLDYLGSVNQVPFSAHGYGGMFTLSLMDRLYREDMTKEEAMGLLQECITEIQKRFLVDTPRFKVRLVTMMGVEDLGYVNAPELVDI